MAVLEKIRKRSVLLFIIIIGALLAFILGDFFNSGRTWFGNRDTFAKVGNTTVKQQEYSEMLEKLQGNYADADYNQHIALHQAMLEKLMEKEFDRLGIDIDDEFISSFIQDPVNYPIIVEALLGPFGSEGSEGRKGVLEYIGSPKSDKIVEAYYKAMNRKDDPVANRLLANWQNMESNVENYIKYQLFSNVMEALVVPNKADAKAYHENANNTANVAYAKIDYASIPDSDVKLTEKDYQTIYAKKKGKYQIKEENREVAYIVVNLTPSEKDYQAAEVNTRDLIKELTDNNTVTKTNFSTETGTLPLAEMKNNPLFSKLLTEEGVVMTPTEVSPSREVKAVAKVVEVKKDSLGNDESCTIALYTYNVEPSQETVQQLTEKLNNYVINNPSAENFAKNDPNVRYALLTKDSFTLDNPMTTPGTLRLIKWAMNAENGEVSQIYTLRGQGNSEYLVAAALLNTYDEEIPVTSKAVQAELKNEALKNKKAQMIIDKYKNSSKNLEEFAKASGTSVNELQSVSFNANNPFRGKANGAIAGAKKGQFIAPIQGEDAVYVVQVNEVTEGKYDNKAVSKNIKANQNQHIGYRNFDPEKMLLGNRIFQNFMLDLMQDEEQQK